MRHHPIKTKDPIDIVKSIQDKELTFDRDLEIPGHDGMRVDGRAGEGAASCFGHRIDGETVSIR